MKVSFIVQVMSNQHSCNRRKGKLHSHIIIFAMVSRVFVVGLVLLYCISYSTVKEICIILN